MVQTSAAVERAERNRRVFEARERGEAWRVIAEREGISLRQAYRCEAAHREVGGGVLVADRINVDAAVHRVVESHIRALAEAEQMCRAADNSNARVGALRSVATIGSSLLSVLGRLGLLSDSGLLRYEREVARMAEVLNELGRRHDLSDDEIMQVVDHVFSTLDPPLMAGGRGA